MGKIDGLVYYFIIYILITAVVFSLVEKRHGKNMENLDSFFKNELMAFNMNQ